MQRVTKEAGKEAGLISLGVILIAMGVGQIQQGVYVIGIILVILGLAVILVKELLLEKKLLELGIYV